VNILKVEGISKSFPGVQALDAVHIDVSRGEVVALVGENGAGKSTLMKILAGIHQPDSGTIQVDGNPVELRSPRDAAERGIAIIHQELELVDTLDVAGNIFLGREWTRGRFLRLLDVRRMWTEAERVLERLGAPITPQMRVRDLSPAHKQLVEIARAISLNARILLMDEPTSSLTAAETDRLFEVIRELKIQGVSIIYISHRLAEVRRVADRVLVLRDGRNAGELIDENITHDRMIRLMVGRDLDLSQHVPPSGIGVVAFKLQRFRTIAYPHHEVSLEIRGGEILGIAGLIGAGRSELARAVFGVDRRLSGDVLTDGNTLNIQSARDAIGAGVYLIPEDRRNLGLVLGMTIRENVTLPGLSRYSTAGLIHKSAERRAAGEARENLQVKTASIETDVANLSGGNQQKVVLAKWLSLDPKLILFDEPTRGIDVTAKAEIYALMRRLARDGVAIVMISSDMEEILANSDRVAVMREGQITGILEREQCNEEAIMRLAVA